MSSSGLVLTLLECAGSLRSDLDTCFAVCFFCFSVSVGVHFHLERTAGLMRTLSSHSVVSTATQLQILGLSVCAARIRPPIPISACASHFLFLQKFCRIASKITKNINGTLSFPAFWFVSFLFVLCFYSTNFHSSSSFDVFIAHVLLIEFLFDFFYSSTIFPSISDISTPFRV